MKTIFVVCSGDHGGEHINRHFCFEPWQKPKAFFERENAGDFCATQNDVDPGGCWEVYEVELGDGREGD